MRHLSLSIALTLSFLAACRNRGFNSSETREREEPAVSSALCKETLSQEAPFTPAEFRKALVASLNQAGKGVFQEEHFRDFIFSEQVPLAIQGRLTGSDLGIDDDCSLIKDINKSLLQPAYFYWLTGNGRTVFGGMVLYKGDIFAEGFYRNRSSGVDSSIYERRAYLPSELFTQQPWLEWKPVERRFEPHVGGVGERIIEKAIAEQGGAALELHTGTTRKSALHEFAVTDLGSFRFGDYGAFFTTPHFEAAKGWANPVVLSAKFDPKTFLLDSAKPNPDHGNLPAVYVGIEYDYVEIAFLYSVGEKSNLFYNGVYRTCVVKDKAINPGDKRFAPACP